MKKTKTTNITRKFAAVIAAAIMMTTTASFAASASTRQAVTQMNVSAAMKLTKEDNQIIDLSIEELVRGIEVYVPGGKFITPVLKLVTNSILGKGDGVSLNDINAKLDDMFSKLDKLNADLRNSLENITAIQNFDSFHFTTFNSQIGEIINQIETIRKLKISEENKYAQIAALVGSNTSWTKSNNVFVTFSNVTQALNRPSLTAKGDLFDLLYSHYSKTSMFSGEAIDKASYAADLVMTDYMAGYYALMQCLSAQAKVCNMTAEQKSRIDPKYLSKICDSQQFVTNKINQLKDAVIGNSTIKTEQIFKGYLVDTTRWNEDEFDYVHIPAYETKEVMDYDSNSLIGRYNKFKNSDRMIFINKGTANDKLSKYLTVTDHNTVPVYASGVDGSGRFGPVFKSTRYFNENITPKMGLDGAKIKAIAAAAGGQFLTVRQYLKKNGFNVDHIPAHANILTGAAYHDANSLEHVGTAFGGYLGIHTFYKGIDIDSILTVEREVALYHAGCKYYGIEEWNYVAGGNIVTFNRV